MTTEPRPSQAQQWTTADLIRHRPAAADFVNRTDGGGDWSNPRLWTIGLLAAVAVAVGVVFFVASIGGLGVFYQ